MNGVPLLPGRLTVAVASGKGGTGKTLVATNLAAAVARAGSPVVYVDCDVEAPNGALFLHPVRSVIEQIDVPLARVDAERCTLCGACRDACAYGAVRLLGRSVMVFPELCHGCGACVRACPTGAMGEQPHRVGEIISGSADDQLAGADALAVVTGQLDIGEVKAPSVIRAARRRAALSAGSLTVLDAPPGVACAAVAATLEADVLVLVTEPTPFGLHDLDLAVALGREMRIPMGVVLNRMGMGSTDIEGYCARESIPVIGRIPFDRRIAEIYAHGGMLLDEHPSAGKWFDEILAGAVALAEGGWG